MKSAFGSQTLHGSMRANSGPAGPTELGPGPYPRTVWTEDRWGVETLRGSCIPGVVVTHSGQRLAIGLTLPQALDFGRRMTTRGVVPAGDASARLRTREVQIVQPTMTGVRVTHRIIRGKVIEQ